MILKMYVKPNSKTDSIHINETNELNVRIHATPVGGKANKYLVSYLSEIFKVPKSFIHILKGLNTSYKTIEILAEDEQIKNILNTLSKLP